MDVLRKCKPPASFQQRRFRLPFFSVDYLVALAPFRVVDAGKVWEWGWGKDICLVLWYYGILVLTKVVSQNETRTEWNGMELTVWVRGRVLVV